MLVLIYLINYIACGSIENLNFDDIAVPSSEPFTILPRPYYNFIFKRINTPLTGYIDDHLPVFNTTGNSLYVTSATSNPNVIVTTGENLAIITSNNANLFDFYSINMTSIFIDQMAVNLTAYHRGVTLNVTTIILTVDIPYYTVLNWKNIDQVIIGCYNYSYYTCAHIGYDNVVVK